jgi:hypothetical protein
MQLIHKTQNPKMTSNHITNPKFTNWKDLTYNQKNVKLPIFLQIFQTYSQSTMSICNIISSMHLNFSTSLSRKHNKTIIINLAHKTYQLWICLKQSQKLIFYLPNTRGKKEVKFTRYLYLVFDVWPKIWKDD